MVTVAHAMKAAGGALVIVGAVVLLWAFVGHRLLRAVSRSRRAAASGWKSVRTMEHGITEQDDDDYDDDDAEEEERGAAARREPSSEPMPLVVHRFDTESEI